MRFEQFENSGARLPTRATAKSAGYDLRALEGGNIGCQERKLVGTGICWKDIPTHLWGEIKSRSGLASEHGIDVKAGTIDADYNKEIKVLLSNNGPRRFYYDAGDRIAQMVIQSYCIMEDDIAGGLRTGGLGSTGNL